MNQMIAPYRMPAAPIARSARMTFTGENKDFRNLVTRGTLLEVVTFGFYRFWLATSMRRHLWANTAVEGDALEYTGRGRELFIGFLFAMAILMPVYIGYFLLGLEAERLKAFASLPLGLFFYGFAQFAVYRARRYRLTRTVWRGVRFWMTGSGISYALRAFGWAMLVGFTLGLAHPWRVAALERYKMGNTYYGGLQGRFEGDGWTFFKRGIALWIGALFTFILFAGGGALIGYASMMIKKSGSTPTLVGEITLGGFGMFLAILVIPFLYPALQAIEWKWWLQGVRFGNLEVNSNLRARSLIGNMWKVIGVSMLVGLGFSLLIGLASAAIIGLGGQSLQAQAAAGHMPYALIGTYVVLYLATILALGVVRRIYLTQRVWKIVVSSVMLRGLEAVDDVVAEGDAANAIGEGLADGLDVAGF